MNSAQKVRSTDKKTSDKVTLCGSKSAERTSTGKKLVQARLPFKIILPGSSTGGGPGARTETDSSGKKLQSIGTVQTETVASSLKKRKLDFNDETTKKVSRKSISKSDIKENMASSSSSSSTKIIAIESSESETDETTISILTDNLIVELHKESDSSDNGGSSECSSKVNKKNGNKSGKLKIKFPFNNKKKRNRRNDSMTSKEDEEDDTEVRSNPLKKLKKDDKIYDKRDENNATPSSVIELVSDDDEPIDDSDDTSTIIDDVRCLFNEESNEKDKNICENEEKALQEKTDKNGADKVDTEKKISSKAKDNDEIENSKDDDDKTASDDQESSAEKSNHANESILVEDDENSKSSKLSCTSQNSKKGSKLKNTSVRINKTEFNKLLKDNTKSGSNLSNNKNSDSSEDEEDKDSTVIDSDKETEKSMTDSKKSTKAEESNSSTSSVSKVKPSPKLTPVRGKKLKEMEMRREERLKAKEEKEKKLQEEKEQKKKEKEERELQKKREKEEKEELRRKEREEKEELRRKEKEEKEKKRLAEIEAKNEEKRQKEEERKRKEELKEEERRKREEERKKKEQEKEEAENKKKRAAQAFTKFFVQQKPSTSQYQQKDDKEDNQNSIDSDDIQTINSNFMPFQIKDNMKLAPLCRKKFDYNAKSKLDNILAGEEQSSISVENLYLKILKNGKYIPGHDTKTHPKDDDSNDVLVIEDELEGAGQVIDETIKPQKYKAKFLYFHENQRPAYYGTWRKKSKTIKPRRPFATDTKLFDYEVDSDDEWEEEEPGESLDGSDDEKDKESEDEYEVDNEFFVPHGHLSEEEMGNDEENEDNSPETQKAKLKILQQEFAQEMKKKTEKIKPKLVGIVWQDKNGNKPELCPDIIWSSLNKRAMIFTIPPIVFEPEKSQKQDSENGNNGSPTINEQKLQKQKEKPKLSEDLIKDLICLFHGNINNREFLIKEFHAYIAKQRESNQDLFSSIESIAKQYPKSTIRKKIDKMAEWAIVQKSENNKKKKLCWIISEEYLKKYGLEDLKIPNKWNYILQPKKRIFDKTDNEIATTTTPTVSSTKETSTITEMTKADKDKDNKKDEKRPFVAITKFTKVLTKKELAKQMKNSSDSAAQSQKIVKKISAQNGPVSTTTTSKEDTTKHDKKSSTNNLNTSSSQPSVADTSKPSGASTSKPSGDDTSKSTNTTAVKKRVPLLLSVPRGEKISQDRKDKLISDFLRKDKKQENNEIQKNEVNEVVKNKVVSKEHDKVTPMEVDDDDDVVVIN